MTELKPCIHAEVCTTAEFCELEFGKSCNHYRAEREIGISKFQKITGTSYIEAKSILTSLKQAGAKVVE